MGNCNSSPDGSASQPRPVSTQSKQCDDFTSSNYDIQHSGKQEPNLQTKAAEIQVKTGIYEREQDAAGLSSLDQFPPRPPTHSEHLPINPTSISSPLQPSRENTCCPVQPAQLLVGRSDSTQFSLISDVQSTEHNPISSQLAAYHSFHAASNSTQPNTNNHGDDVDMTNRLTRQFTSKPSRQGLPLNIAIYDDAINPLELNFDLTTATQTSRPNPLHHSSNHIYSNPQQASHSHPIQANYFAQSSWEGDQVDHFAANIHQNEPLSDAPSSGQLLMQPQPYRSHSSQTVGNFQLLSTYSSQSQPPTFLQPTSPAILSVDPSHPDMITAFPSPVSRESRPTDPNTNTQPTVVLESPQDQLRFLLNCSPPDLASGDYPHHHQPHHNPLNGNLPQFTRPPSLDGSVQASDLSLIFAAADRQAYNKQVKGRPAALSIPSQITHDFGSNESPTLVDSSQIAHVTSQHSHNHQYKVETATNSTKDAFRTPNQPNQSQISQPHDISPQMRVHSYNHNHNQPQSPSGGSLSMFSQVSAISSALAHQQLLEMAKMYQPAAIAPMNQITLQSNHPNTQHNNYNPQDPEFQHQDQAFDCAASVAYTHDSSFAPLNNSGSSSSSIIAPPQLIPPTYPTFLQYPMTSQPPIQITIRTD